ncbi:hypothetical protein EC991_000820 [Linnemannia zychae]|nr:hypothetical protein EC991_000820 [Linnemannia zychae]
MKASSIIIPLVALAILSSSADAVINKMRCKNNARAVIDDFEKTKEICYSFDSLMRFCPRSKTYYCQVAATSLEDGQRGIFDRSSQFKAKCNGSGDYIDIC